MEPEIRPGDHGKLIAHDGFRGCDDRPRRDMDTFRLEARARAKRTELNYRTLEPRKVQNTNGREGSEAVVRLLITMKASNDEIHQKIITTLVSILMLSKTALKHEGLRSYFS